MTKRKLHLSSGASGATMPRRHEKPLPRPVFLSHYMRELIEQLRLQGRYGTAANYEKTLRVFSKFMGGKELPLTAITGRTIADFNTYLLRRGLLRNSISFYMRILKAVYNKAVRQRLVRQTFPFSDVYTGVDATRKRAIDESFLSRLNSMQLPSGTALALARDIFVFSYCARGMAFVDIVYLLKADCVNGAISYTRRKTGQLLTIRVEPAMQRIIERNASHSSPYLFPILTSDDSAEAYRQYLAALNNYNYQLSRLSALLNSSCKLTSYTARHSWATAARNHNVPLSVISAGMGHTSEQTTRIYLAALDNSVIDEANRGIIESLG
ncbi:MAG: site-specific integrase [Bacteroidaceae bacterium]|nr:site-specific integrase [Bacteroidaceae bacterium]